MAQIAEALGPPARLAHVGDHRHEHRQEQTNHHDRYEERQRREARTRSVAHQKSPLGMRSLRLYVLGTAIATDDDEGARARHVSESSRIRQNSGVLDCPNSGEFGYFRNPRDGRIRAYAAKRPPRSWRCATRWQAVATSRQRSFHAERG